MKPPNIWREKVKGGDIAAATAQIYLNSYHYACIAVIVIT